MGIEAVEEEQSTQLRRQSRTVQRVLSMSDGAVSLGWIEAEGWYGVGRCVLRSRVYGTMM